MSRLNELDRDWIGDPLLAEPQRRWWMVFLAKGVMNRAGANEDQGILDDPARSLFTVVNNLTFTSDPISTSTYPSRRHQKQVTVVYGVQRVLKAVGTRFDCRAGSPLKRIGMKRLIIYSV